MNILVLGRNMLNYKILLMFIITLGLLILKQVVSYYVIFKNKLNKINQEIQEIDKEKDLPLYNVLLMRRGGYVYFKAIINIFFFIVSVWLIKFLFKDVHVYLFGLRLGWIVIYIVMIFLSCFVIHYFIKGIKYLRQKQ